MYTMKKLPIINLIILISTLILLSITTPNLPQAIHSMHLADFQQFSPNKSQQIMAYYDFNYDEYCDILTIATHFSPEDKSIKSRFLTLYLWNDKRQTFVKSAELNLSFLNVVSVIATQFYNRNEPETDLALTYHYVSQDVVEEQTVGKKFAIELIKAFCNMDSKECGFKKSFSMINELKMFDPILPSIIVLQGRPCLLFRKNSEAFTLSFLLQQTGEPRYEVFSLLRSGKYLNVEKTNTDISTTLAYELSYFGDYNGDGIADLVVSQKITNETVPYNKIHFFRYDKDLLKFTLQKTFDLKLVEQSHSTWLQFFTLNDINFDGRIDLVVLFKSGLIQVHYNRIPNSQVRLIESNGFEMFPFDLYQTAQDHVAKIQRIVLPTFTPISTSGLLFGDFNLDGFEDLIIDCQYKVPSGQLDQEGQPIMKSAEQSLLLINTPCTTVSDCGDSTFNERFLKTLNLFTIRKFSILETLPITYRTNDSFKMFFIDLYKDGKLDLVSHRLSSGTSFYTWDRQPVRSRQVQIYFNNVHYDAFFMKVRVMRGANYDEIHGNLVVPGGNVNFFVTSLGGQMLPKVGNQYSQVGRVMQLPYVFFGLGRTNNYVNELTITIPYISLQHSYQNMWTPIVPNSQVVTLANPEGKWHISAFIEPTQKMGLVAFLVVVSLIVLGVVICRLTIQEKNEDKENLENFYSIL